MKKSEKLCETVATDSASSDWLTVAETGRYMRAGKTKTYQMIRNGDVESYRLGRKILVSRKSIDRYIAVHGTESC